MSNAIDLLNPEEVKGTLTIRGDAANDRAEMAWIAADVTNQPMHFIFMYRVI